MGKHVYTPSVVDRIRLLAETRTYDQIAAEVGVGPSGLREFCRHAGIRTKRKGPRKRFDITLDQESSEKFNHAALERGVTLVALLRMILETIAADDMIGAVLADDVFNNKASKVGGSP